MYFEKEGSIIIVILYVILSLGNISLGIKVVWERKDFDVFFCDLKD